jgi:hypothetical protein
MKTNVSRIASVYTTETSAIVQRIALATRKSRTETVDLHLAYSNATYAEEQAELRKLFMIDWIIGDYSTERIISGEEAETILDAGKGKNTIDAQVIDRAYSGFRFHVVRPDCTIEATSDDAPKAKGKAKAEGKPATKAEQAAMAMFIQLVGSRTRALELLNNSGK